MLKRLWGVTLLLMLASNLCLAQYRFNGTFYQLRWGQTEGSQDLITPVNALGNPLCVKTGTSWSAYLDGAGNLLGWKVSYARLRSLVDGTVYFTVNDPGVGNLKPPGQPYPLPNLPAHVDHAQLDISYVIYYWGSWGPVYYLTPIYSSEVFIVLDAPKAPMNPAWVNVLRYSCRWASQAQDVPTAARKVTNALHLWGAYQEGVWFARNYDDTSETFYVRQCLERLELDGIVGQCNDFADLLLCLQTSLGVADRAVQRTHPLSAAARVKRLPNGHDGELIDFTTHTLDVAPWGDSPYDGTAQWTYHQFVIETSTALVWDGCLQFLSSYRLAVIGMLRDTDYRDHLVRQYNFLDVDTGTQVQVSDPSFFWVPTPQSGLIPSITSQ